MLCRAVSATEVLTAQQVVKNEHGEEVRTLFCSVMGVVSRLLGNLMLNVDKETSLGLVPKLSGLPSFLLLQ